MTLTAAQIARLNNDNEAHGADAQIGTLLSTLETKALVMNKVSETVAFGDFTDGGGAVGTLTLTASIPQGAVFYRSAILSCTGFAGDTSAALTIGDGTDVDRYNASTINVFADALTGIDCGAPAGLLYHPVAKDIVLTITTAADFTSVSAGALTLEFFYLT